MKSLFIISSNFEFERRDIEFFMDKEIKRVKVVEHQEYLKYRKEQEDLESIESIEEIKEPEKIPEIWSTFQNGQIAIRDYFHFKMYSKVNRMMKYLAKFVKERRMQRHPVI